MLTFRPRLLDCLVGYTRADLRRDALAGVAVSLVALPLALSLGIASGVSPGAGLLTAIIGGFLISALGGSRVQIGGPAGAFVGLVSVILAEHGPANLLVCTAMAGVFLFVLGAARLGTLIKFIPHPVTTGFTCGIAITIMLTQVRDFFGLDLAAVPADFPAKLAAFGRALPSLNPAALLLAAGALAGLRLWPARWARAVPGSIAVVGAGTWAVHALGLPVETIGSRFGAGALPAGWPDFALPALDWGKFQELLRPALAITLLGAIESLLSAVVADGMIDDRHDSNQELMAQGVANFAVPFFGGLPVTGVIARTATNVRSGARSPVAGMVHAAALAAIVAVAAPLVGRIPLAVLAAVLVSVALNMGEWDEFLMLRRHTRSDAAVFLVTFVLTVVFDLGIAVEIGMILAAGLFIKRVTDTTRVTALDEAGAAGQGHEPTPALPPGVLVYRVFGALLFGAADKLDSVLRRAGADTRVVILHLASVTALDATALNALQTLHAKLRHHRKHLVLCGPHTQPYALMERAGFLEAVGAENVVADLPAAAERARALVAPPP